MKKICVCIAVTALVAVGGCRNSQTDRLTEDSVRRFLAHRDTLMVQGDVDQISTLFDTNAMVVFGTATSPDIEMDMDIQNYLESFSHADRPAYRSHQTIAEKINIDANGRQAEVEAEVSISTEMGKRKRILALRSRDTLAIGLTDGYPKIVSLKQMITGNSLEPDELSERIISMIQEGPAPGQKKAIELLEEIGGTYTERKEIDGRTTGEIRFPRSVVCGDEAMALASWFSESENLMLTVYAGTGVTDKGLQMIQPLDNLALLWLVSSQITDAGLAYLAGHTNLVGLVITGTPITDAGLVHLENLKQLKLLTLMGTKVTGAGIKQLREQLPNLKMLVHESLIDHCKESRNSIDYAKRKWAEKQDMKDGAHPTEADLKPHLTRRFSSLKCQDGGTFSINPIGEPASCSVHGKTEPRKKNPALKELSKEDFDIDGAKPGRWTMDLEAARKLAAEKQLPILLNFTGSDWCYWCKLMEKNVFSEPDWKAFANDHLVMVLLDFPRDKSLVPANFIERNNTLKKQYGITGYPTFVLLKPDGKTELGRLKAGRDKTPASFIEEVKAVASMADGH